MGGSFLGGIEDIAGLGELACLAVGFWGLGRREARDAVGDLAGCGGLVVKVGCPVCSMSGRPRFGALACSAVAVGFEMLAETGPAGHELGGSFLWYFGGKVPIEVDVVFRTRNGQGSADSGRIDGGGLHGLELLKPASRLVSCSRGAMRDSVGGLSVDNGCLVDVGPLDFLVVAKLVVKWLLPIFLVLFLELARSRFRSWIWTKPRARSTL